MRKVKWKLEMMRKVRKSGNNEKGEMEVGDDEKGEREWK
jgi:hypothetical protein